MTEYFRSVQSSEANIEAVTDDAFDKQMLGARAPVIVRLVSEALDSLTNLLPAHLGVAARITRLRICSADS